MANTAVTPADHKLIVAGERLETGEWQDVQSPYDGSVVGRVPVGDAEMADRAIVAAHAAFEGGGFPQYERAAVLERAAHLVRDREDELTAAIAAEAGKPVKTARIEAQRCVDTLILCSVEAHKLTGETVPMEGSKTGVGKVGVILRVPYGVVGAISPFNFPLNLVAHKLGPALAAGNAIVLKPAGQTPVSAIMLAEILLEAGVPDGWLSVVCGSGSTVGEAIVKHELTKAITFTGSSAVGWNLRSEVPHKKVNLELGSTAPLVINGDGDWETAADKAKLHAFSHAGQSCISIQRIIVHESLAERFTERLVAGVKELVVGDPLDEDTDVGPLITEGDRDRVKEWIDEAAASGAEIVTGGELVDGDRCLAPTLIRDPGYDTKVWREEIFGPVATINTFSDFDEGLAMANDAQYGLNAGVFTDRVADALEAGRVLEFGSVLINEVPTYRADLMPYGGVKDSGNTREGPAYAVRELTETRLLTLQ